DLRKQQTAHRTKMEAFTPAIDAAAKLLYDKDPKLAIEFLTDYTHNTALNVINDWRDFGNFLLVKYLDG
ncbi:MAG TPA: dipeptidase, partial [Bacteroidales bacterium]|nr:dipeptidase [Bacteroidales bacterium]